MNVTESEFILETLNYCLPKYYVEIHLYDFFAVLLQTYSANK